MRQLPGLHHVDPTTVNVNLINKLTHGIQVLDVLFAGSRTPAGLDADDAIGRLATQVREIVMATGLVFEGETARTMTLIALNQGNRPSSHSTHHDRDNGK